MGMEELRAGIVKQAVEDWLRAMRRLEQNPQNETAKRMVQDVERFIQGRWFRAICDIPRERLLRLMQMQLEEMT